jgi:hypothetical protein
MSDVRVVDCFLIVGPDVDDFESQSRKIHLEEFLKLKTAVVRAYGKDFSRGSF